MTAIIVAWVLWNLLAPDQLRFDHYPFIFLTLMLSLQASYAAPLILLAQNRQADRDRVRTSKIGPARAIDRRHGVPHARGGVTATGGWRGRHS